MKNVCEGNQLFRESTEDTLYQIQIFRTLCVVTLTQQYVIHIFTYYIFMHVCCYFITCYKYILNITYILYTYILLLQYKNIKIGIYMKLCIIYFLLHKCYYLNTMSKKRKRKKSQHQGSIKSHLEPSTFVPLLGTKAVKKSLGRQIQDAKREPERELEQPLERLNPL